MIVMNTDKKIAVIGGDARQIFCAKNLCTYGFETALYGFDKYDGDIGSCTKCKCLCDTLGGAEYAVLPLPCCTDGLNINAPLSANQIPLESVFSAISQSTRIYSGKLCPLAVKLAEEYSLEISDYSAREEFQIANAVPTAESALAIAVSELPITICKSTCLVMGYGRIGKILCDLLRSFGAKVYASARKCADFAWIEAHGCIPVHTDKISDVLPECSLIFNTIPKTVLKDRLLDIIPKDTLIIDLASKPGGVDFEPAKKAGLNVIWALSLPGKTAPVSAGKILSDTVINILRETEGEI